MRVLIETRMNALRLTESKAPKKGCLGRLEGVCADFKNPTRNGRLYPLELWKKVFDDELFKESLQNKTLFGELDHPEDRFEPLITEACVVMTDYRIDEDKGLIYGGFDILDTPSGRILKTVVDYGSVVGVSSRGQGDIVETADGERVDEDSYEFACFDVVSTPAVAKARQNVMESIKRVTTKTFDESIRQQIKDAETVSDLNIIRSVVRTSDLNSSEMESLIESIEDRCRSIQSGETITESANTATSKPETDRKVKSAKTIRENKKLYKTISDLRKQVRAYEHRESRYVETVKEKQETIDSMYEQLLKLKKIKSESAKKHSRVQESLGHKVSVSEEKLAITDRKLSESTKRARALQEQVQDLREKLSDTSAKSRQLESTVTKSRSEQTRLQELLSRSEERVKYLEDQVDSLSISHNNEISNMDSEIGEYNNLLTEAQTELSTKTDKIRSLTESLKTCEESLGRYKDRAGKLTESLKAMQDGYIRQSSKIHGINPDSVKGLIKQGMTPQQIDNLIESVRRDLDRASKVGITDSDLSIGEDFTVDSTALSDEDSRLLNFLNAAVEGS